MNSRAPTAHTVRAKRLDPRSSERLEFLRFPLIVGVIFVHAYESTVNTASGPIGLVESNGLSDFVRNFVSNGLGRVSPPLFFFLSGFLVFCGTEWNWNSYQRKLQGRVRSLLVPYLFWNLTTLLIFLTAQNFPMTKKYISGENHPILEMSPFLLFDTIFGITQNPIAYQFWFIRDLMIAVVCIPIIVAAFKYFPKLYFLVLTCAWFIPEFWFSCPPSALSMLFFSAGGYVAFKKHDPFELDRFGIFITIAYAVVLTLATIVYDQPYRDPVHKIGIMLGVPAFLYVSALIPSRSSIATSLKWLAGVSFFVFAIHQPMLTIIKKLAFKAMPPHSDFAIITYYFAIPLIVIGIAICIYLFIQKLLPEQTAIICGGRSVQTVKRVTDVQQQTAEIEFAEHRNDNQTRSTSRVEKVPQTEY